MISVCIATYNGAAYIGEQLKSIVDQLSADDEIIISDDNSTDDTLKIVKSIATTAKIKIVKGPCLKSSIANFEHALKTAQGDYIFLADQDDIWMPDKVAIMMEALQTADCVVSDCTVTDGQLNETQASFYALNNTKAGLWHNLLIKNGYLGCCMAFKRDVCQCTLPFPKGIPMHDIWIGNVAAVFFKTQFIPERLIKFRRHQSTSSCTARTSPYTLTQKMKFRWVILSQLIKLYFKRKTQRHH